MIQINGLNRRSNSLINNQIADKLSGPWSETWGLGGVNCTLQLDSDYHYYINRKVKPEIAKFHEK